MKKFLALIPILGLLLTSCSKDSTNSGGSSSVKHLIKITVEGKTYSYSYDQSGCSVNASACGLPDATGYAEYKNNRLSGNLIVFRTGALGGLQFNIIENCTNNCVIGSLDPVDWKVGTYTEGSFTLIAGDYYRRSVFGLPKLPFTIRITQSGEVGSVITGTFSGKVYKQINAADYEPVDISGEFSAPRFN